MSRVTRGSVARLKAEQSPATTLQDPVQLSSPPTTPESQNGGIKAKAKAAIATPPKSSPPKVASTAQKSNRKRARAPAAIKDEDDINELPHNLGKIPDLSSFAAKVEDESPTKKRKKAVATSKKQVAPEQDDVEDVVAKASTTPKTSPKKKNNNYGLTPGQTPYPNWIHPTPEECHEVNRLLSSVHGEVKPPEKIPPPSLTVTGCGEVPSVLDALIRTLLSAATTGANSARAFAGLVQTFGILQEGIGKGSVDWNKVRLASQKEVFDSIKSGGLADVKSKNIKKILEMVWEENQARREELQASGAAPGSEAEDAQEKNAEILKAQGDVLSLDHLHLLSNDDAFNALTKYPGIGPKTASCVSLFCLRRPSFAVDTHVFRLCTWLGWVPPSGDPAGLPPGAKGTFKGPNRNSTYAHCDVRIPDDLKYPLHQLFIKHGKTCPRCRAITGENSEGWDQGCVIDHLVKRTGVRKGDATSPVKGKKVPKKKVKSKKADESDTESELSELSDLSDEDEE